MCTRISLDATRSNNDTELRPLEINERRSYYTYNDRGIGTRKLRKGLLSIFSIISYLCRAKFCSLLGNAKLIIQRRYRN